MRTRIMTDRQVHRTLDRLAHEILERNRGATNLVVVGIVRAGAHVARELVQLINHIEGTHLKALELDTTRFRDDKPQSDPVTPDLPDLTDKDVILVDDVLFTGRTARAALDAVVRTGRPRSIQLLVLIDRGHREYPIQPDYVGRIMPTKHRERVEVSTVDWSVDVVE
ncbi:MAG: bifunctional pyr operon transcriptional regulator/uracil phosphoribosyltransferase PyrR [Bacteroidetes bacterium]|nr:bifunctional pyr operon transcriptional regulator/uracil phosphoribosyltransferase PyrR [Bacteroidota bacterium]